MPNEQEKFLEDTQVDPTKVDVLEAPLTPDEVKPSEDGVAGDNDEQEDLKPRNRRERRLLSKLADERESSSFLAGKLAARTEAEKSVTEEKDYLKAVERIYGTDTPEAQIATDLLKKAILGAREDAQRGAIEEIKAERRQEIEEQKAAEKELDEIKDEIEDEYGVTLTVPQERAFFQLMEKMSPKDKEGNVREYADPHAVWEVLQDKIKQRPLDTRAKDMSSRSMTQSGAGKESNLESDVTARFLKENGII